MTEAGLVGDGETTVQRRRATTVERDRRATLRVGIAGAGFMGAVHARCARLAGAQIAAVAASTPERSATAAAALGAERAAAGAEELVLADDIDVVHVCTPNHLHAELARAALEAGKHVVCEKPLGLDAPEARGLADLADGSDRVATVPFVYRFHPMAREARARIGAGELGALRVVHGGYLQDWLSEPGDDNWRVDPRLGGASRALADIGSHWFDLVEFLSGDRIAGVCATTINAIGERSGRAVRTEDGAAVLFRLRDGATGTVLVSQVSPGRKNDLHVEIAGERASLRFEQERPETLWLGARDGARELWRDPALLSPDAARLATVPVGHPQGYNDAFAAFVADTYDAIAGERPEGLPRFSDGARAADVVDAVLRSAAAGRWEEVPS
jgi:predicted dehydrogenase